LQILRDVAEGMAYLHSRKDEKGDNVAILHLDLKPANILLDESWRAKIADFGMSRISATCKKDFLSLVSNVAGGTPIYMAPELLKLEQPTTACDVYSYGIMAWEVLYEKVPYKDAHPSLTLEKLKEIVVTHKKRPADTTQSNDKLMQLCEMCWKDAPGERKKFTDLSGDLTKEPWNGIIAALIANDKNTHLAWQNALKRSKLGPDEVSWGSFLADFASISNAFLSSPLPAGVVAMAAHLGVDVSSTEPPPEKQTIKQSTFNRVLNWFGPFNNMPLVFQNMQDLASEDWFFGDLDQYLANDRLAVEELGTFLIRFSQAQQGVFTISYVGKTAGVCEVIHERLTGVPPGRLIACIGKLKQKGVVKAPCKNRPAILRNIPKRTAKQ